jgi:hypothetical protein
VGDREADLRWHAAPGSGDSGGGVDNAAQDPGGRRRGLARVSGGTSSGTCPTATPRGSMPMGMATRRRVTAQHECWKRTHGRQHSTLSETDESPGNAWIGFLECTGMACCYAPAGPATWRLQEGGYR